MRAVVIAGYGGVEVLAVREVPEPVPGPDDVLIDVACSAMNRADLLQRKGLYPAPGPKPEFEIPGLEYAGTIAALGERVTGWSVGDEVMGIVAADAQAERIVTHERMAARIPRGVQPRDAAAIPEAFITAHDALVAQGGLACGGDLPDDYGPQFLRDPDPAYVAEAADHDVPTEISDAFMACVFELGFEDNFYWLGEHARLRDSLHVDGNGK